MATLKDRQSIKDNFTATIKEALENLNEEVLLTKTNTLAIPFVYPDGEEGFITLTVAVPTGSRDGDAYDGYAEAEDYVLKQKEKTEKAKAATALKEKKLAAKAKK